MIWVIPQRSGAARPTLPGLALTMGGQRAVGLTLNTVARRSTAFSPWRTRYTCNMLFFPFWTRYQPLSGITACPRGDLEYTAMTLVYSELF